MLLKVSMKTLHFSKLKVVEIPDYICELCCQLGEEGIFYEHNVINITLCKISRIAYKQLPLFYKWSCQGEEV